MAIIFIKNKKYTYNGGTKTLGSKVLLKLKKE